MWQVGKKNHGFATVCTRWKSSLDALLVRQWAFWRVYQAGVKSYPNWWLNETCAVFFSGLIERNGSKWNATGHFHLQRWWDAIAVFSCTGKCMILLSWMLEGLLIGYLGRQGLCLEDCWIQTQKLISDRLILVHPIYSFRCKTHRQRKFWNWE